MEARALSSLPSSSSSSLQPLAPGLQTKHVSFQHAFSFFHQSWPKASAVRRNVLCKLDPPSEHAAFHHFRSWRSCSSNEASNSSGMPPFQGLSAQASWAPLLLYRALLLGGIGLLLDRPALACPPAPPATEVVVEKPVEIEKDTHNAAENSQQIESPSAFEADFWKDMDVSRGSRELILKNILDGDPTNLEALECLAKTFMENDDSSRALAVLERLEALQPHEVDWKLLKAETYDMDGKYQQAKKVFEDVLKVEPFSLRALQGLILAMDQLDESDSAIKIIEDTWKKAKREASREEARDFGMLMGQVFTLKGRMQEALQLYKGMIEEDKKDFRPYLCQGIIYCVLGDTAMAEQQFQTYEKLCPKDQPGRESLDRLMARAKKEGQKVYDWNQKQKQKQKQKEDMSTKKGS